MLLQACNLNLDDPVQVDPAATQNPYLTTPRPTLGQATAIIVTQPQKTDINPTLTPTKSPPVIYTVQSGDTLAALAARFGVQTNEITSADPIAKQGLLKPGQLLIIPRDLGETSPPTKVLPDS